MDDSYYIRWIIKKKESIKIATNHITIKCFTKDQLIKIHFKVEYELAQTTAPIFCTYLVYFLVGAN